MTYDELYRLIYRKYKFVERPSNEELQNVLNEILRLSRRNYDLNDDDLDVIINVCIKNKAVYLQKSIDMTDSINIIQQILAKLQTETNG